MKRAAQRPRAIMNPFPCRLKNNNNNDNKKKGGKKGEKENLIDTCNYSRSIIYGDTVRSLRTGKKERRNGSDFYRDRSFVAYRQAYYFIG